MQYHYLLEPSLTSSSGDDPSFFCAFPPPLLLPKTQFCAVMRAEFWDLTRFSLALTHERILVNDLASLNLNFLIRKMRLIPVLKRVVCQ